ncbi:Bug family tripartite tricarboxylate transporter substrate binding protein [Hydrogenophaga pseudoflava]|uniref:Bug family tripartite tricarboxylate transporter substrate binding protein n=1 Tax=Hydrogenophaga pseudoflava TaxID=47421 RepID=UPI0027E50E96|nr:tripartite tricarboxylate transporter substrate binding protein [Hydrogenophaga pseudoflava]MDQ7747398.1 tripartite tricarboxylate transporter substrate binding protein [Hydrogenophaga pseudoflava]
MTTRRTFVATSAVALSALATSATFAQSSRISRLIVGGAPSSIADMLARPLAEVLGKSMNQPMIVENKPGAAGFIAIADLLRSPSDGQTLMILSATAVAWNQFMFKKLPYDPEHDIVPVAPLAAIPMVIAVNPKVPAKTLEEFIALAKKEPNSYTYGFGGIGTPSHVSFERFRSLAGIDVVPVPYKSGPSALQDLMGGRIDVMLDGVPLLEPYIRSGRLRALAMATPARVSGLPEVPTVGERGLPEFDAAIWVGVGVRRGTEMEVVNRLNGAINVALDHPIVKDAYTKMGAEIRKATQRDFAEFVKEERGRWGPVIQRAKISLD